MVETRCSYLLQARAALSLSASSKSYPSLSPTVSRLRGTPRKVGFLDFELKVDLADYAQGSNFNIAFLGTRTVRANNDHASMLHD